jgi:hypothetical protein
MVPLDVVVFLEQAVVVIIVSVVILRVDRRMLMIHRRYRLKLDSRGTVNEVVWGFVFCTEADITWRGQSGHDTGQPDGQASHVDVARHAPSIVTRAVPRPSSPRYLRIS